eukprot:1948498-Pleurochrysis_carterae.AAC.2
MGRREAEHEWGERRERRSGKGEGDKVRAERSREEREKRMRVQRVQRRQRIFGDEAGRRTEMRTADVRKCKEKHERATY